MDPVEREQRLQNAKPAIMDRIEDAFVAPWPSNWLYTQEVFVVEINGMYYLCNPSYPGVNLAISVDL